MEEWREIEGHPGYEVSSEGRVRGHGRMLTLYGDGNGYLRVRLDEGRRQFRVHRLVAEAFIGAVPEGMVVAHKDGVRDHNHVGNLQITSYHANAIHRRAHGTAPCPVLTYRSEGQKAEARRAAGRKTAARLRGKPSPRRGTEAPTVQGACNPSAKLCEFGVSLVFWYHSRGFSNKQVARCTGISDMQVGRILRGEKWKALHAEAKRLGYVA